MKTWYHDICWLHSFTDGVTVINSLNVLDTKWTLSKDVSLGKKQSLFSPHKKIVCPATLQGEEKKPNTGTKDVSSLH